MDRNYETMEFNIFLEWIIFIFLHSEASVGKNSAVLISVSVFCLKIMGLSLTDL